MKHEKIHDLLSRSHFFLSVARQHWATVGWNETLGLFEGGLDFQGQKLTPSRTFRLRSQMRQIYVYAQGYAQTGNEDYFFRARNAFDSALRYFATEHGVMCNEIDANGKVIDARISSFEQAFVIFACAWLFHLTDDERYLNEAEKAYLFVETSLKDPKTGGFEHFFPIEESPIQQNAHMHLMEASLFALLLTTDAKWLDRANCYFSLFNHYLYAQEKGVVKEQFGHGFSDIQATHTWEAGHSGEWVWLLNFYGRIAGTNVLPTLNKLYSVLNDKGVNSTGLAYDLITDKMQVVTASHRLWAQCEVVKSHLVMFERTQDEAILEKILSLVDQLFTYYLDEEKGIWSEQINDSNQNIYPYVPATSFYHLNMMFQELQRVLLELVTPKCQCSGGCHDHA